MHETTTHLKQYDNACFESPNRSIVGSIDKIDRDYRVVGRCPESPAAVEHWLRSLEHSFCPNFLQVVPKKDDSNSQSHHPESCRKRYRMSTKRSRNVCEHKATDGGHKHSLLQDVKHASLPKLCNSRTRSTWAGDADDPFRPTLSLQ